MSTIFPLHSYYPLHNLLHIHVCVCVFFFCATPIDCFAPCQAEGNKRLFLKSYFHSLPGRWSASTLEETFEACSLGRTPKKIISTCKGEALRLSLGILPFLYWPGFKLNCNSYRTKSSTLLNTFQWSHRSSSKLHRRAEGIGPVVSEDMSITACLNASSQRDKAFPSERWCFKCTTGELDYWGVKMNKNCASKKVILFSL